MCAPVKIAEKIPSVGTVFKVVVTAMKLVKPRIDDIAKKAKQFEDKIFDKWNHSIEQVVGLMDDFEDVLVASASVAGFFVDVKASQCVAEVVDGLIPGVGKHVDQAMDTFAAYARKLFDAMDGFVLNKVH